MRPVEALISERDRIIEEYRDLLEGENQALFDAKRGLAATAYPYVENDFYIEHWTMGALWRKIRELSRMMQAEGLWTEPDDSSSTWAATRSRRLRPRHRLGRGRRTDRSGLLAGRDRSAAAASWTCSRLPGPPSVEHPPESITEPFTRMLWGITTEQVQQWPRRRRESGRRRAARHGGLARRRRRPGRRHHRRGDQLSEVQQGEILVATVTAPSWGS